MEARNPNDTRHAAILGHSFVRRLASAVDFETSHNGEPSHVRAAHALRVSQNFDRVYIDGTDGAYIRDLIRLTNFMKDTKIDVVIFNSGSNDLCHWRADPVQLAKNLVSIGDYITTVFDVKLVCYCSAIYRDRCRQITPAEFKCRATKFNAELMAQCAQRSGHRYFSFKGFWKDVEHDQPMPVSMWSTDGIHPGPAVNTPGFIKYRRNMRRCLLAASAELTAILTKI